MIADEEYVIKAMKQIKKDTDQNYVMSGFISGFVVGLIVGAGSVLAVILL